MAKKRYIPLGGSSRRYLDVKTGQTISRRQYLKTQRGGLSNEAYQKKLIAEGKQSNHMGRFNSIAKDFKKEYAKKHNIKISEVRIRGDSDSAEEFKQIMADLRSKDKRKNGRMHRALVAIGRRQPEWTFKVGDTPNIKRRV